jgi:cytochrome c oxidase subunit IV
MVEKLVAMKVEKTVLTTAVLRDQLKVDLMVVLMVFQKDIKLVGRLVE